MVLKYRPVFSITPPGNASKEGESQSAREKAERLERAVEEAKELWIKTQESMTKFYNRKHIGRSYAVGDDVMLSSKNIRMQKASKKLADKFLGPFKVISILGKNAYKLELLKNYERIHPTFHVSLLEPYRRREGVVLPEAVQIQSEDEWEIEGILDERVSHGKRMFLVRWKGYSRDNDSWEPEENLANAKDEIKAFRNQNIIRKS